MDEPALRLAHLLRQLARRRLPPLDASDAAELAAYVIPSRVPHCLELRVIFIRELLEAVATWPERRKAWRHYEARRRSSAA